MGSDFSFVIKPINVLTEQTISCCHNNNNNDLFALQLFLQCPTVISSLSVLSESNTWCPVGKYYTICLAPRDVISLFLTEICFKPWTHARRRDLYFGVALVTKTKVFSGAKECFGCVWQL